MIVIDIRLPLVHHFFCSYHMCGVMCDVSVNRPTASWNLIVHLMIFERKKKYVATSRFIWLVHHK